MQGQYVSGEDSASADIAADKSSTEEGAKDLMMLSRLPCTKVLPRVTSTVMHDVQRLLETLESC